MQENENETVYMVVRMSLLVSGRGSYFIDSPNYLVHKVDSLYCRLHGHEHTLFLRLLKTILVEMEEDFSMDIEEFKKVKESIRSLHKYIDSKLQISQEVA